MDKSKCPFCDMGQEKRILIFRLTEDLSRGDVLKLLKKSKRNKEYLCHKCGKNCGNSGLLAMHMKSPGRAYKAAHRKFDEVKKNNGNK